MAIRPNGSTLLNQYTPPFKKQGDFARKQVLVYDEVCRAFVNKDIDCLDLCSDAAEGAISESLQVYSGTAVAGQAAIVVPWAAVSEQSLIITINGVKQQAGTFAVVVESNATVINFASAMPTGASFEVLGFQVNLPKRVLRFVATGNGTTTEYTVPWIANTERSLFVFVNGVKQQQGSYSLTITPFTTIVNLIDPVPVDAEIEIIGLFGFDPADFKLGLFVGNGVDNTLILPWLADSTANLFITLDGVKQHQGTYAVAPDGAGGTVVTFAQAVALDVEIEVLGIYGFDTAPSGLVEIQAVNLGIGAGIFNSVSQIGNNFTLNFKSIVAGPGVTVTADTNSVIIGADVASVENILENIGTGVELLDDSNTPGGIKSLVPGDGIFVTNLGNEVSISLDTTGITLDGLSSTDFARFLVTNGTISLIKKSNAVSDSTFELYGLRAGSGIVVTRVGDDVVIADANGGNYVKIVADYTIELDDAVVGVNHTAPCVVSLVSSTLDAPGKTLIIKDETGAADVNPITVAGNGQTIDGQPTVTIASSHGSLRLYCDGLNWFTF